MKHLKTYKLFESNETVEFLVEDLFGVDPRKLRDVMSSLLDELEVHQFEIRYSIEANIHLDSEWRHLVGSPDFRWEKYDLFIDDERGLNKVDYDVFERFRTTNNIPYNKFSASISVICYKQHNKNFDELEEVINFINDGLDGYTDYMGDGSGERITLKADKRFSGFLSPDFGSTGYLIGLVDSNI